MLMSIAIMRATKIHSMFARPSITESLATLVNAHCQTDSESDLQLSRPGYFQQTTEGQQTAAAARYYYKCGHCRCGPATAAACVLLFAACDFHALLPKSADMLTAVADKSFVKGSREKGALPCSNTACKHNTEGLLGAIMPCRTLMNAIHNVPVQLHAVECVQKRHTTIYLWCICNCATASLSAAYKFREHI
jgi:hypothetical protein